MEFIKGKFAEIAAIAVAAAAAAIKYWISKNKRIIAYLF